MTQLTKQQQKAEALEAHKAILVPAREAYNAIAESALEAHKAIADPAREAYNAIADPALEAYNAIADPAREAYNAIAESALEAYNAIADPAWNAYNAIAESAREAYEAKIAEINAQPDEVAQIITKNGRQYKLMEENNRITWIGERNER